MYSGVISRFVDCMRNAQQPVIFGDGKQTRDFVFVTDVARANLAAATAENVGGGEVINIATGRSRSLLDVLEVLGKLTGRETDPEFRPARAGDVRHSLADINLARRLLGFTPEYDLERGLRALLESLNVEIPAGA